jgi:ATP-binding protein involved in chromosome partitioning
MSDPAHPPATHSSVPAAAHIIAVGAGKGGVGKSTIALLAAAGLLRRGYRTALLDADVYGPSLPKLTGTEHCELQLDPSGRVRPVEIDGLKLISMGHLITREQAVIWRGPMAQKYVKEFLERADWGEIGYLFVDLPPGTGDIPLTLAQSFPVTAALVVCTPQEVGLLDAVRALRMYQKLGVPFLGAIPLHTTLRVHGDAGRPFGAFTDGDPAVIEAIEQFLTRVVEEVRAQARKRTPLPQIKPGR